MLLSMLPVGSVAVIKKLRDSDFTPLLSTLGFVCGNTVFLKLSRRGDVIVKVLGSEFALGRDIASKIEVVPK